MEDILSIAGIARVGGRTAGEIAERFLARAGNRSGLPAEARAVLDRYLAVAGHPDEAAAALRALADDCGLDLSARPRRLRGAHGLHGGAGLRRHGLRVRGHLRAQPRLLYRLHLRGAGPARPLAGDKPIVGGGRYDRLLQHLGAPGPIPAVGCSFWLDRIAAGTRREDF